MDGLTGERRISALSAAPQTPARPCGPEISLIIDQSNLLVYYVDKPRAARQEACPAGRHASGSGNEACTLCEAGKFASSSASPECTLARQGYFVAEEGATAEVVCAAGTYSPGPGLFGCVEANSGSFVAEEGAFVQESCPVGKFSSTRRTRKNRSMSRLLPARPTSSQARTRKDTDLFTPSMVPSTGAVACQRSSARAAPSADPAPLARRRPLSLPIVPGSRRH